VGFIHALLSYHSGMESKVPSDEDMDWNIQYKCVFITKSLRSVQDGIER
jgi:hypothetical protein